ncbi:NAD(P)-dependent oxidoreductase [Thalassospira alkalitolerans]|uniref:NAD-dependent epimerase/dehydratase family protein n=1 Tax=Thalassospira alkalitolerans TaxID=1293890 RepID=UPI0030EC57C5|tara:strand:- start:36224 stop:37306 length:1083 start_codon:yes stop_codon:yes gene_type:complete
MTDLSYTAVAKRLKGHRVALVGGAGFIGHNLALELDRIGVEVMVFDNLMFNSLIENMYDSERDLVQAELYRGFLLQRFEKMRTAKNITMWNGDARIMTDLMRAFAEFKPTKVVHLSAIASAIRARENPGLQFDLQLVTLRNVLELCREQMDAIDQVMFLSSSTVYGDFEEPTVNENTRPRPKGIYANTKYMGERLLRTYCHQHGMGVTIIRPSALYGERCVSRRVSQIFIENALAGKPLRLEGGGDGRLDFTYIKDLVSGMVRGLALHEGNGYSQTFNLTYGNARTIKDLFDIVQELVPGVESVVTEREVEKPIRGTLSTERAETVLGFKAEWSLEKGYRAYAEWYISEWEKAKVRAKSL